MLEGGDRNDLRDRGAGISGVDRAFARCLWSTVATRQPGGISWPPYVQPIATRPRPVRTSIKGSTLLGLLHTTDHKLIGTMYLVTTFGFFLVGGVLALLMRTELAQPGLQFLSQEQYNQLFTMHGTIMLLLYATPIVFAFANLVLPLQIGAPDVAFPRLNAFSYWLYLFGGLIVVSGFVTPGGAADFGWFAYAPLNEMTRTPPASAATCGSSA